MDDIRTILDKLDGKRLAYVYARSRSGTLTEAFKEAGISRSTYYDWADKDRLDELADDLKRNRMVLAESRLMEVIEDAVQVLVELLHDADKDSVRLQAARTIMERVMGPVTAKVDMTTQGQPLQNTHLVEGMMELLRGLGQREQDVFSVPAGDDE